MSDIKLKAASGGGSISLKGPSSLGSDRDLVDTSGNINLLDSQKLNVGTGNDLTIEHTGSASKIINNTGYLNIRSDSFWVGNNAETEGYISAVADGAVTLSYNGADTCYTSANGLAFPSGKGIDFSATSDANGKDNELLDDYEEGTWNPAYDETSVTASSYHSNRGGNYTKIGNLVTFTAYVQMTSSTVTGNPIFLEGLPFTSHSSKMQGGASFGYADNWGGSSSSATAPITMHVGLNESKIRFYDGDGNQIDANNVYDDAKRGIHIRGFYYV